jgi:hypothetical protein
MQTLVEKLNNFNLSKSNILFEEILNELYPNATRCKDCGGNIIYYDTNFSGYLRKSRKTGDISINLLGKSFLTKKTHGESLCICESCLKKTFPSYKPGKIFNTISDITVYAFDIKDRSLYFTCPTKEKSIKKHGDERGLEIWNKYCKRQSETNTFEYKAKKYGMTKEEFAAFNKTRGITLKNLIKKYGERDGTQRWNMYVERQRETKTLKYMIERFGVEKAESINKSKGLTLGNFINKYGEVAGLKRYEACLDKFYGIYSTSSQDFFDKLDITLSKYFTTYYGSKNTEYCKHTSIGFKKLDYFIKELNLCIEYNGDIFHGNPSKFIASDTPNFFNRNITCQNMWDNDAARYNALKTEHNIDTLIVWESDVKTLDINEFINNIIQKYRTQHGILL